MYLIMIVGIILQFVLWRQGEAEDSCKIIDYGQCDTVIKIISYVVHKTKISN